MITRYPNPLFLESVLLMVINVSFYFTLFCKVEPQHAYLVYDVAVRSFSFCKISLLLIVSL